MNVSHHTVRDCVEQGKQLFTEAGVFCGHGTDNVEDEALWLVFSQLGLSWNSSNSILDKVVNEEDYQGIQSCFHKRITERIPAAYITGEAWFAGYPFIVSRDVLVPRSPIAELIENAYSPWLNLDEPKVLDLCTGSGCIGIASALKLTNASVVLTDISPGAIAVARRNIRKHEVGERVSAFISDGFNQLRNKTFDLIVCNPPYVDADDLAAMPAEYLAEPLLALASGKDGLDLTRRLLAQAADHLNEGGSLIVEVGNSYRNLEYTYPTVPFMWLDFEHGGHGVFVMTKAELEQYRAEFRYLNSLN